MGYPTVSVILVNYNSKKYAEEAIDSILSQDYPKPKMQIIVVDNASSDDSVNFLKKTYGSKIELILSKTNLGFAGGNNLGFKSAKGELFLLFNIDAIAPKDFLKKIVSEILQKDNIIAVAAFDFPPGTNLGKEKITMCYTQTLLGSNTPRDKPGSKTLFGSGCVLLLKKNKVMPHFDEDYFMYFEDTKLGWEFNSMGYEVLLSPKCRVWHYGSAVAGKVSPLKTYYSERNRIMTLLTCYDAATLIKLFPMAVIDFFFRVLWHLFNPKLRFSFLKAMLWDITHLCLILKKRKEFNKLRKLKDRELFNLMSYRLFPSYRNRFKLFWNIFDFFTKSYLRLVGIITYDM